MNTNDFLLCLARTESDDTNIVTMDGKEYVLMGDAGRALARFQCHPDWIHTQEVRFGIQPELNETWDSFITRLVTKFFEHHVATMQDIEVAMYFHLGHRVAVDGPGWDEGYARRFQVFAADFARGPSPTRGAGR